MRLFLLTGLAMLAFAGNSIFNRMAVGGALIDPASFALVRVAAGAVMLGALVWWRDGRALPAALTFRPVAVAGLSVYLVAFSLAYAGLATGTGALVLFGVVQITMFAGAALSRDAMPAARWLGALVAFSGLLVLLLPGPGAGAASTPAVSLPHAALMAAAGLGWGVYSLAGRGASDALGATAFNFIFALPVVAMAWAIGAAPAAQPAGLVLAMLSGAATSGLGYALWYHVLPALGASRAAVAQLTVPVIAAVAGVAFLAEGWGMRLTLSSLLVLGGVTLATRGRVTRR